MSSLDQIQSLYNARRFEHAAKACESFLQDKQSNSSQAVCNVWLTLAECRYQMRNAGLALRAAKQAAEMSSRAAVKITLGKCYAATGQLSKAVRALDNLLLDDTRLVSLKATEQAIIAATLFQAGRFDLALTVSRMAWRSDPGNPAYSYNHAMCLRAMGAMDEAVGLLNEVVKAAPNHWEAYRNRSDLKRWSEEDNHIEELVQLLDQGLPDHGKAQIASALGKELHDCGKWQDAFHAFAQSAAATKKIQNYDVATDLNRLNALQETFSASVRPNSYHTSKPHPIFILGLPRSGSTLLERILSAHTDITACGELPDFTSCFTRQMRQATPSMNSQEQLLDRAMKLDFFALGEAYLESVFGRFERNRFFTDKMPANSLNVGLILRALPNAKILITDRNELDQGYALYRAYFGRHYPYANDLGDIGAYLPAHRRLMRHWQSIGGSEQVMTVRYEALVTQPDQTVSEVLNFLGLPLQENLLALRQNMRPETSASAAQIREGIHTNSIGVERHLETELSPLRAALKRSL